MIDHLRPTEHRYSSCMVRCFICGATIDLNRPNKPKDVVTIFMDEHKPCVANRQPSACCVMPDCFEVGLGPMQRCADHGGERTRKLKFK